MHRRRLALASSLVLLAAPALASCGFDYATDRVNTNAAGTTDREGDVKVLGMLVVAGEDGIGNLTGSLSNYADETDALVSITGGDGAQVQPAAGLPLELGPDGTATSFVNLAALIEDDEPITLVGDFGAGDIVPMVFEFENADTVRLDVPVDKPCDMYEGLAADPEDLATEEPTDEPSEELTDEPSEGVEPSEEPTEDAADEEIDTEPRAAYDCAPRETPGAEEE